MKIQNMRLTIKGDKKSIKGLMQYLEFSLLYYKIEDCEKCNYYILQNKNVENYKKLGKIK